MNALSFLYCLKILRKLLVKLSDKLHKIVFGKDIVEDNLKISKNLQSFHIFLKVCI